jgi:drug/metabolite transporter (DMT)-like permease
MKMKSAVNPYLAIGFAILAVSTASIFIRLAQREAPSLIIAAARMTIAFILLAPSTMIRKWREMAAISIKTWLLIALSGLLLAMHFASWITSLEKTSVASSVVLVTTAPLWVALLSTLLLRERLTKFVIIGLIVALMGGVVVGLSQICTSGFSKLSCESINQFFSSSTTAGNLLALAGAIFSSGYLIIGRVVRKTVSLESYIFLVYGIAAIALVILVAFNRQSFIGFGSQTYLFMFLIALIPQLIGHSTYNWALKYLSAVFVSIALLGEPIGSAILAFIFLKEPPTIFEIIGGVLIFTGIIVASQAELRNHRLNLNAET